jgi:hypothetical protein
MEKLGNKNNVVILNLGNTSHELKYSPGTIIISGVSPHWCRM